MSAAQKNATFISAGLKSSFLSAMRVTLKLSLGGHLHTVTVGLATEIFCLLHAAPSLNFNRQTALDCAKGSTLRRTECIVSKFPPNFEEIRNKKMTRLKTISQNIRSKNSARNAENNFSASVLKQATATSNQGTHCLPLESFPMTS